MTDAKTVHIIVTENYIISSNLCSAIKFQFIFLNPLTLQI